MRTKNIALFVAIISLTACSPRDTAMHMPQGDYLHKDLAEERDTEVVETQGSLVVLKKAVEKVHAKMDNSLSLPLKTLDTQETIKTAVESSTLLMPVDNVILTSRYSYRNPPHRGDDYAPVGGKVGQPVKAAHGGRVVETGGTPNDDDWGYYILLEGEVTGNKIRTRYAHLNKPATLKVGTEVKRGDTIGYLGNTGPSTGPHLHLEVSIWDPDRSKTKKLLRFDQIARIQNVYWFQISYGAWSLVDPSLFFDEYTSATSDFTKIN